MGVDCRIVLPPAAQIRDVADVMAALAGFTMQKQDFSVGHDGWYASLNYGDKRLNVESCDGMPYCARILITAPEGKKLVDGERQHYVLYHFEGGRRGERLLMPPSTDFWLAIGKGLVDFFGGTLDYNDCDDSDEDYAQPERPDIHAEDGELWYSLQERKLAVRPLTKADLKAVLPVAAYQ